MMSGRFMRWCALALESRSLPLIRLERLTTWVLALLGLPTCCSLLQKRLVPEREQVANVFAVRRNFQVLHVGFQHFHLNTRQAEHRSVVIDELAYESSRTPEPLGLFLEDGGLFGREAEGLSEVVVSGGRFGHWTGPVGLRRFYHRLSFKYISSKFHFHLRTWTLFDDFASRSE